MRCLGRKGCSCIRNRRGKDVQRKKERLFPKGPPSKKDGSNHQAGGAKTREPYFCQRGGKSLKTRKLRDGE